MKAASTFAKPYIVRNLMETREQLHTLIDELPIEAVREIVEYIRQKDLQSVNISSLQQNFQKILAEDDNLLRRLAQ
jgi:hypothetical protein